MTINSLGFLSSNVQIGYNDAASYINTLMYFLRKEYTLEEVEGDERFIPGRAAWIVVDGKRVGIFGETHPQVLESWGCSMPAIMAEINIDKLI